MTFKSLFAIFGALVLVTGSSMAQTLNIQTSHANQAAERPVRVQSSISFFLPGGTADEQKADELRDRAKRAIYESAARECNLLRDILARDCRIEAITSNIGRQQQSNQQDGYSVNGQVTLVINLK